MENMTLIYDSDKHRPYCVGRQKQTVHDSDTPEAETVQQYIMDWRSCFPKSENDTPSTPDKCIEAESPSEETPAEAANATDYEPEYEHQPSVYIPAEHSSDRHISLRLAASLILTLVGIVLGVALAAFTPAVADLSTSLAVDESGGFGMVLLRRMLCCGAFLIAEYVLGYFACGGFVAWVLPLLYGMGRGVCMAAAFMVGQNQWVSLLCVVYSVLNAYAAYSSWEFSAYLLDMVFSRGEVITEGGLAGTYSFRFVCYCGLMLLVALLEAAGKMYFA